MSQSLAERCPSCGGTRFSVFYEVANVPVHSVLLLPTREKALHYTKRDIMMAFCEECGFIWNTAFDPSVHEYSEKYEETQGFSSTFNEFHRTLAERIIDRFDLHGKTVIEIGCGKGEFLSLLCELGANTGIGFDPAYIPDRNVSPVKARMTFVRDFYGELYANYQADFVCCKMTLEHIPQVLEFMQTVRRSIGDRRDTIVFFQIPEVRRVLRERAFWDIYYEHCSYFSQGSLARLFRKAGFDVTNLWTDYDDQYLMVEARPGTGSGTAPLPQENDIQDLRRDVRDFASHIDAMTGRWQARLQEYARAGKRVVIWGGGSKGVAFLTKLNVCDQVTHAVDINPYKKGTFMAGTGQEIVMPEFLTDYKPDVVVIMNPIYTAEIHRDLEALGLQPTLLPITLDEPSAAHGPGGRS